jgi:pseudooxynicotine oxidase
VHWHQPHTWSEITRAGLDVELSDEAEAAGWYVDGQRRGETIAERDAIARRGWDSFVDGVRTALPKPHDPLFVIGELASFDRLTIAERLEALELGDEERDVLTAELESLAHAPLTDAGAVSVLRWHALAGYSLELTQFAAGRVTIAGGTRALLEAIATAAIFERRLSVSAVAVAQRNGRVEVQTREGDGFLARAVVVAVPINALPGIDFEPSLPESKLRAISRGQASRGIKIFIHARGEPARQSTIRPGHPFGYLGTEIVFEDGTQLLIGFGADASDCDARDLRGVQRALDEILPGYEVLDATAHDWLADEHSRGTWAIHRPGWYAHHHAAMQTAEGQVILAGSDIANGWAGFIDGAIESGLRAGERAAGLSG